MSVIFLLAAMVSSAESPYLKKEGSWISLEGTVVEASDESFELDYGDGMVTVEMDGWDWYDEGKAILEGDKVEVYGRVDDDFYELTTIEASSVYVKDLNTYFYASAADEENYPQIVNTIMGDFDYSLTGKVTSVSEGEFTIDTGERKMTVKTNKMKYNPLDEFGYQQIEKGDWVSVSGDINFDLMEDRELEAEVIVTLVNE